MINNRLISSNTVIAKVIADADLRENEIRISDMKEWLFEGMQKIGAIPQYEHKIAVLPIKQHQASLPCDLYKLGQVAYSASNNGGWLPMRKTTSSFSVFHDSRCNPNMLIKDVDLLPLVKNMFNLVDDKEALDKLNETKGLRDTLQSLVNQYTVHSINGVPLDTVNRHIDATMFSRELQYDTKPGYIITSMPCGFVKIAYYAIYTDEDSMPMIPDMESYKECLYWYVMMKLMYPKKLRGQINQNDYIEICNSYNFYRKQAYAEAMMPEVDDMESVKNQWLKLYPELNDHDLFFSTTGDEQYIFNQNNYWQ